MSGNGFKTWQMLRQLKRLGNDEHVLFMYCCIYSLSYPLLAIEDSSLHVLLMGMALDVENSLKELWNQEDGICPQFIPA
jgi:hypothetical protein